MGGAHGWRTWVGHMRDVHGQTTYAGYFEKTLKRYIHEALKQNNPNYDRDARAAAASAKKSSEDIDPKMFKWTDGSHHTLPENYILTCRGDPRKKHQLLKQARTPLQAYMCWNLPNLSTGICAIRNCNSSDFSLSNQGKRFSDWKILINLWHRMILLDRQKLMDGRVAATEAQWQNQFQQGMDIYLVLCKFFHPSAWKRKRLRKNPSIALAYRVSTVLNDLREINKNLFRIKCFFAFMKLKGFFFYHCKFRNPNIDLPWPRINRELPEHKFTIPRWLEGEYVLQEEDEDELIGLSDHSEGASSED